MKANSTRPALLFTNNGNVKLTAHPAIDTSAGRDSLFLRVENFSRAPVFPPFRPPRCCTVLVCRHSPSRILPDSFCFSSVLSFPLAFPSFHAVHRNALGVRCTFIIALLSQVCVIIFRQEKQGRRGRRAVNKGEAGRG